MQPVPDSGRPVTDDWVSDLATAGPRRQLAESHLHALLVRAARHQVSRMPEAATLGQVRRDEVVTAAADEATVAVLRSLDRFEGRSRFTTWAYKFGIHHAGVEVRRAAWSGREVQLHDLTEPAEPSVSGPEAVSEAADLARAVREGMQEALTPHQRRVAVALLVDDVPIDVLAERLGSTRNTLYKTLHDARRRLRAHLSARGYLGDQLQEEVLQ